MTDEEEPKREWVRLREVMRLTGWDLYYVRKLEVNGALETRQDFPRAKRWYRRSQVMELIK